jgi:NADH-quinone oxidoreductase subunit M
MDLELTTGNLLLLLVFSPFLGILALSVGSPSESLSRSIACISATVSFILSLVMFSAFDATKQVFQLGQKIAWLPEKGITFTTGVDGLSVWLIVLTTFLTLLVTIASTSVSKKLRGYLISILFLEVGMLGTFVALDVLSFYVFWELMLIPMYFLIGVWGGKNRIYAAVKFVIYTAFGSLLMLVAIAYLQYRYMSQFGHMSFFLNDLALTHLSSAEEFWLFAAFALAFLIKVPVFPVHTWLPDAHVEAPTGGSVILAGVLLKMGIYGLVRFGITLFPHATIEAAPFLATLGIIGIIFGALVAWVQTDIKKLVAYSSVSHMGFCVLGFAMLNEEAFQGALLQLINHGITTAALFFLVGVLYDRKHTREISAYGGLAKKIPIFSFVFMVFMLSSIGLPLTNGFVGEFLVLLGTFKGMHALLGVDEGALLTAVFYTFGAVSGVILGALYMISLYRRVVYGPFDEKKNGDLTDLTFRESVVFAPLLVLVFVIGLYPQIVLQDLKGTTQVYLGELSKAKNTVFLSGAKESRPSEISPVLKSEDDMHVSLADAGLHEHSPNEISNGTSEL